MSEEEQPLPTMKKRRGRKPKAASATSETSKSKKTNSGIVDEALCSDSIIQDSGESSTADTIPQIIQIPKSNVNVATSETNYEKVFCDYNPVVDIPNAYDKDDSFSAMPSTIEDSAHSESADFMFAEADNCSLKSWPRQTEVLCFWCSHSFSNVPVGIPIKLFDGKFYCTGTFCSFSCAAAYNYNVRDGNHDIFERNNLINLMASKFGVNTPVRCAKPREMLKIFGGDLSINDFRKNDEKSIYFSNKYPIMAVSERVEEVKDTFNTQSSETFTIQKTPIAKQKTMNDFV